MGSLVQKQNKEKYPIKSNKLQCSINLKQSCPASNSFPSFKRVPYVNHSHRQFTVSYYKALSSGPKYVFNSKVKKESYISDYEAALHNLDNSKREEIRFVMYRLLKKVSYKGLRAERHLLITLKKLQKDPNIIFIRTDKRNKISTLGRNIYMKNK